MTAKVLWRDAQGIEGSIELGTQEIRVGRSMDCAIRTDDAMVSRHHARIVWAGAGYMVEDLGSANKVYYQEQVVQQHMLRHGDAVRCGSLWLRFVDTAQLGQPAPAPVAPPAPAPMPMPAPMPAPMPIPPTAAQVPMPAPAPMAPPPTPMAPAPMAPGPAAGGGAGDDEEIRRLRRRIEQLQAELRAYRGGKVGQDKARRMEDLENDLSNAEVERDRFKRRIDELEGTLKAESGSAKVQRAVEIRGKAAEMVTSLNDVLSSLRIEVMAAEGEFDQYSHQLPRASFELIRQSMKNAADFADQARELLRSLREIAS
ncbi:MAG: FHA domain-containing protein [Kofleriaceae bacterium]|nr:FHA domain-containing protein [Kofleriaceae bacterium]MBP9171064.1 FHA domain-containing protein [Kofleriaceae bacterium]